MGYICFLNTIFQRSKSLKKAYIFKAIKLQKICNVKNSTILKKEPSDHSIHYFSTIFLNSSFELNSILDNFIIPYGVRNQKLSKNFHGQFYSSLWSRKVNNTHILSRQSLYIYIYIYDQLN